jgi:hypothetical protein
LQVPVGTVGVGVCEEMGGGAGGDHR